MNWKDKLYTALIYVAEAVAVLVWILSTYGAFGEYTCIPFYGIPAIGGLIVSVADI